MGLKDTDCGPDHYLVIYHNDYRNNVRNYTTTKETGKTLVGYSDYFY